MRVIPDLTESDGTGAEPVGLLDTTGGVLNAEGTYQSESQVVVVRGPPKYMWGVGEAVLTTAVFLAALVASCLRGAFPVTREDR